MTDCPPVQNVSASPPGTPCPPPNLDSVQLLVNQRWMDEQHFLINVQADSSVFLTTEKKKPQLTAVPLSELFI